ncbi:MAG: hypothetical protein V2I97_05285 [Desulfococcaceae bacterium]|jgi:type I restriction enzyme R subunit|nr:hypothetical protein [Desulfococcaceae bacterium]
MAKKPTEHKSVQARILKYADEIGWDIVTRAEAEQKRGFNPEHKDIRDRAKHASIYFEDVLFETLKAFNPKYPEVPGTLIEKFSRLKTDIYTRCAIFFCHSCESRNPTRPL